MTVFEMVKYHKQEYPSSIPLRIEEIAAHLDVLSVSGDLDWSLHTEYSYGKRNLNSDVLSRLTEIKASHKDGVPQLWKSKAWAEQFAEFIFKLVNDRKTPAVIEIHPAFDDYIDIKGFADNYAVFEDRIKSAYPSVEILVENRCGSVYKGGKFVLSKLKDAYALADEIDRRGLSLKIAYDVPQIYTAHNARTENDYISILEQTKEITPFIGGVHLWGKRYSDSGRKVSHCGDLNSYFENEAVKSAFLSSFKDCFNDGVARKMVLEVNSGNEDLNSIISDLLNTGVSFT